MTLDGCPCCGAEPQARYVSAKGDYGAEVLCPGCGLIMRGPFVTCRTKPTKRDLEPSMELAVAAWNRRAERTCHAEPVGAGSAYWHHRYCSECGKPMLGDSAYCPQCGRKVVRP